MCARQVSLLQTEEETMNTLLPIEHPEKTNQTVWMYRLICLCFALISQVIFSQITAHVRKSNDCLDCAGWPGSLLFEYRQVLGFPNDLSFFNIINTRIWRFQPHWFISLYLHQLQLYYQYNDSPGFNLTSLSVYTYINYNFIINTMIHLASTSLVYQFILTSTTTLSTTLKHLKFMASKFDGLMERACPHILILVHSYFQMYSTLYTFIEI